MEKLQKEEVSSQDESEGNKNLNLNADDKKDLLDLFNMKGYLLEDKVTEILNNHTDHSGIWDGDLGIEYERRNKERVEIDTILKKNRKVFVIDTKRTTVDWIFSPSLNKSNALFNFVCLHPLRKYISVPMNLEEGSPIKMVKHDFAIGFDGEKLARKNDKKTLILPREGFRPIHDAIRQVLKESKAVILEGNKYISEYNFMIPMIVTNARILHMEFEGKKIEDNGDLVDYESLTEIKAVGYNFNESFRFNSEQGLSSSRTENITKTVIIVNIHHLKEIIEYLSKLYVSQNFRTDKKSFTSTKLEQYDSTREFWETN